MPWADNPKLHDPEQVEIICQSIEATAKDAARQRGEDPEADPSCVNLLDGWGAPLQARAEDKVLIAGHGRVMAAHRLGIEWLPVRYLNVSEAQAQRLARADNRIAELSPWNQDKLLEQLLNDLPSDEELQKAADDAAAAVQVLLQQGFDQAYVEKLYEQLKGNDVTPDDGGAFGFSGEGEEQTDTGADYISFAFGDIRGKVGKDVYDAFSARYRTAKAAGAVMLDEVLRSIIVEEETGVQAR